VERVISDRGLERIVCLGDVIGRGDPNGCVAWVRDRATVALSGNRDLDHLDWVEPALEAVVQSWPRVVTLDGVMMTHGDPGAHAILRSNAERESFRRVGPVLEAGGARIWLFGHTHFARIWALSEVGAIRSAERRVRLSRDGQYVVNVGTAGLPMRGKGGLSMVVYDDQEDWVEIVALDVLDAANSI
jgi:predicted phosphodiesterase